MVVGSASLVFRFAIDGLARVASHSTRLFHVKHCVGRVRARLSR
jgi:hypothetical protein